MPSVVKLYEEFKEKDFVVLGLNIREKRGRVKRYVEKMKLPFPILLDKDGRVANTYRVRAHPSHFFINREGEFIGKTVGARDWVGTKNRNFILYLIEQNEKK